MPPCPTSWPSEELLALYSEGLSAVAVGAQLGISGKTVIRHLRAAGAEIRRVGPRTKPLGNCPICEKQLTHPGTRVHGACIRIRYPIPAPRPCEQCGEVFQPEGAKVARGAGRFHSYSCWNKWRTGRPQREWRAAV